MKKALTILVVLISALAVFAGGTAETAKVENKYNTIVPGKFTVATSPDFAPYEFYAIDANGKPSLAGFDISLAKLIASELGLELEIIPMDFDGTIMELQSGNVDASLAGYSPSPERADSMEFSSVYYLGGQSYVTLKQNTAKYNDVSKLNDPKIKVGAQIGSIQVGLAEQYSSSSDIVKLSKVTDIISEIMAGSLDGGYIETLVAEAYCKSYPQLAIACKVPYDAEGSVVGIKKGNKVLLEAVNKVIDKAVSDGTMAKFVAEANELSSGNIYEGLLEK